MAALTKDRDTPSRDGTTVSHPVAAGAHIYAGALVVLNASSGYAAPGSTATGLVALGRAEGVADNSSGADGAVAVVVRKGCYRYANLVSDPVTRTGIGGNCYIVDDQTVAATSDTNTRSVAGKVVDLDASGVWVLVG